MSLSEPDSFLSWFQRNHGTLDSSAIGFKNFPPSEGGRGAVALKDIPEGHTLFTIPRSLTLSTRTSPLPDKFGLDAWKERKLHQGWSGLILCMMWETSQGSSSRWAEYLASLPGSFSTPMFWSDIELEELKGTSVVEKLGKDEAEHDYSQKLIPAIQSRPDLFPPDTHSIHYTLEQYHVMGSRILSRSFDVERSDAVEVDMGDGVNDIEANTSIGSAMDVDASETTITEPQVEADYLSGDEDDEEEIDVSMVPMADLLNARYESENAKLFYERTELKMVSTKPIKAGEQIWNTYGDLPNSELLRRYGHVDSLLLPSGAQGNPGDVVEIRADLVVSSIFGQIDSATATERIDWWLEEGGDDVIVLEADGAFPPTMVSLIRLLFLPMDEWEKTRDKGKPPKPKLDTQTLSVVINVLQKRIAQYPTTVQEDEDILGNDPPLNKRNAVTVRLGEKTILHSLLEKASTLLAAEKGKGDENNKRKVSSGSHSGSSKGKKMRR